MCYMLMFYGSVCKSQSSHVNMQARQRSRILNQKGPQKEPTNGAPIYRGPGSAVHGDPGTPAGRNETSWSLIQKRSATTDVWQSVLQQQQGDQLHKRPNP